MTLGVGVGVGVGGGPESQDLMAPTPFQKFDSRGKILSFKGLDRSPTQPLGKKGAPLYWWERLSLSNSQLETERNLSVTIYMLAF